MQDAESRGSGGTNKTIIIILIDKITRKMTSIPKTMRSLVAPHYCWPTEYTMVELPVPTIEEPDQVLIKVHAGTISTGETQFARGGFRVFSKSK